MEVAHKDWMEKRLAGRMRTSTAEIELVHAIRQQMPYVKVETQAAVGPYRVDILIGGWFVVEVHGDFHDFQIEQDKERKEYIDKELTRLAGRCYFHTVSNMDIRHCDRFARKIEIMYKTFQHRNLLQQA